MIRINLLEGARAQSKKTLPLQVAGQQITIACSVILIAAAVLVGWRYWTLGRTSTALDTDIAKAQQETVRLHSIIQKVQEFEQRRAQLSQRVVLIEQLRRDQTGPVHMLDEIREAPQAVARQQQALAGPINELVARLKKRPPQIVVTSGQMNCIVS